jgi:lysophospholipase L1-like esterase
VSPYQEPENNTWYLVRPPNQTTSYGQPDFDFEITVNSLGIRDSEHSLEKPSGEFRIIGLGDSFTEGQGARYENTYLKVLERTLNANTEGIVIKVISGGVAGSDPFYCYRLLHDKLLKFNPNLVTLTINSTDIYDIISRGGKERFLANKTVQFGEPPKDEWLFVLSHFYRFIKRDILGYDWYGLSEAKRTEKRAEAVIKLKALLADFKRLGSQEGFEFLVILHPDRGELRKNRYGFDADGLKDYMRYAGIAFINLLPHFARHTASEVERVDALYWEKDFHHNAAGYEVFAGGIAEYILDQDLIRKAR